MRPLRLDLHGFTVFREPTTVDLTDADFFALVGPTGSGKSTVLDAICFALYGTVPRWGDRRRIDNALAPSANEAKVRLVSSGSERTISLDEFLVDTMTTAMPTTTTSLGRPVSPRIENRVSPSRQ